MSIEYGMKGARIERCYMTDSGIGRRWIAEGWYLPWRSDKPWQCITYGWTKRHARRKLQRLLVRVANDDGGIV